MRRQRASHSYRQDASKTGVQRVVPMASRVVRRLKVLYIFIKFERECTKLAAIPCRSVEACIKNRRILFRNWGRSTAEGVVRQKT
jgi:hypothetical protein